ncbi:MAG: DUF4114 domain-containing protein [Candidatus Bathyarchaeia archaeon]
MKKVSFTLSLVFVFLAFSSLTSTGSAFNGIVKIAEESSPPLAEPSLQDWFVANGYAINVTADETGLEVFEAGYYRVSILAEIACYAPLNNVSYYFYLASNGVLQSIFQGENVSGDSVYFLAEESFGLCLGSPEGYFYTETCRNDDGEDHALVFRNPKAEGYIIAWEDLWGLGDADYQDMVLAALAPVNVKVCYCPRTLNPKSHGKWITAIIVLPCGFDAAEADLSSIMLNGTIPAETKRGCFACCRNKHILIVKFDRQAVIELVKGSLGDTKIQTKCWPKWLEFSLTVTGKFLDGTPFQGTNKIRVLNFDLSIE